MTDDLRITGAEQFAALAAKLKKAGERGLRADLLRGLRSEAKPLIAEARQAARQQLPRHGGLNVRVANDPITVRVRTVGNTVGVRIVTTTTDTRGTNAGRIRHPVFGNRDVWVTQEDERAKGWFSDTLANSAPQVQRAMMGVLADVASKLTGGAR